MGAGARVVVHPLTAYKVHMKDGTSYVTSMAAGVTLATAKAYFLGMMDYFIDEPHPSRVPVSVEQVVGPAPIR